MPLCLGLGKFKYQHPVIFCSISWQLVMTIFDDNFWGTYFQLVTWDIRDTDYNTDNWEPGFMTIFVTWQLIVTLDNICNSCDVLCVVPDTHLDTDMQLVVSDSLQICLLWFNQLPVIRNTINLVQFVLSKGNIEYHLSLLVSVFWDISYLP